MPAVHVQHQYLQHLAQAAVQRLPIGCGIVGKPGLQTEIGGGVEWPGRRVDDLDAPAIENLAPEQQADLGHQMQSVQFLAEDGLGFELQQVGAGRLDRAQFTELQLVVQGLLEPAVQPLRCSDLAQWRDQVGGLFFGLALDARFVDLCHQEAAYQRACCAGARPGDARLATDASRFAGTLAAGQYRLGVTGYLLGDELAAAFASADIFTFTGAVETFGQVVQEAMASGLPSVVINEGGVGELVIEGETGYTCPADPAAFAAAVRTLRDEPALRAQMGFKARQIAEGRPWERVLAQLEGHYSEAIRLNQRLCQLYPSEPSRLPSLLQWGRMPWPEIEKERDE